MKNLIKYVVAAFAIAMLLPLMVSVPVIGFWAIMLVVVFFGVTAWMKTHPKLCKVGRVANAVVIVVAGVILFWSMFPMTSRDLPFLATKVDLEGSKAIDKVRVTADVTWEASRTQHAEEMDIEYRRRLSEGDTKGATKVEMDFYNTWDKARIKDSLIAASKPVSNYQSQLQLQSQSLTPASSLVDSIFTKGTYYIAVNGVTPFIIHIVSNACSKYATRSDKWYELVYVGGSIIHDGPGVSTKYPNLPEPKFQLRGNSIIKLVVS